MSFDRGQTHSEASLMRAAVKATIEQRLEAQMKQRDSTKSTCPDEAVALLEFNRQGLLAEKMASTSGLVSSPEQYRERLVKEKEPSADQGVSR